MKFTINDKTYFVKWEYVPNYITTCVIYDNTTSYSEPLISANTYLAEGDKFCKNTGRKISLDRALNKLFPYSYHIQVIDEQAIVVPDEINVTHQEYRAIAWKEYFNESPKRLK